MTLLTETGLYAQVVVDLPFAQGDRIFDYAVPAHLVDSMKIGSVVLLPFSNGRRIGYVVGLNDRTEAEGVREIESLIEVLPAFDSHMVELCRWLSEHYLSTLSEAVKLALPPGRTRAISQVISIEASVSLADLPAGKRGICEFLIENGGSATADELKKAFGSKASRMVASLVEAGLASKSYRVGKPSVEEKTERVARSLLSKEDALARLTRAPKQRAIMEILLSEGEKPVAELLMRSGATSPQVKALIERGFIEVERRRCERLPGALYVEEDKKLLLTSEQHAALEAIENSVSSGRHRVFLLHGVTGSGKTEVYLRAISSALSEGKTAIALVPEISLTPQVVARFRARFGDLVAVLHSGLSDGERYDQWLGMRDGRYRIVVGARSALFAPLANIGLIVVDEEHEAAYKQGKSPRYHARDVAIERARLLGASVVLGSATPSLESRLAAGSGTYGHLVLSRRANDRPLPPVELVDMRKEPARIGGKRTISVLLQERIGEALDDGGKVMLLLNRRGFSNFLLCPDCGYVPFCSHCAVSLNYHRVGKRLRCHHCGHAIIAPSKCPQCGSHRLHYKGAGTQRSEEEIRELFPDAEIVRMDADTTGRKNAHQVRLDTFRRAKRAILLGTQMIAKGLDFPDVTLVGVLDADTALHLPDFRAAERTFQLVMQVSGRAGRGERPGRVVIQTYSMESDAIQAVIEGDYEAFFERECEARRALDYPPFSSIVRLLYSGPDAREAADWAQRASMVLRECPGEMLGPAPAPLVRLKDDFRFHLLIKTKTPEETRAFVRKQLRALLPGVGIKISLMIDVDPVWVL